MWFKHSMSITQLLFTIPLCIRRRVMLPLMWLNCLCHKLKKTPTSHKGGKYKLLQCFVAQLVASLHRDLMGPGSNPRTVTNIFLKDTVPIIFFNRFVYIPEIYAIWRCYCRRLYFCQNDLLNNQFEQNCFFNNNKKE